MDFSSWCIYRYGLNMLKLDINVSKCIYFPFKNKYLLLFAQFLLDYRGHEFSTRSFAATFVILREYCSCNFIDMLFLAKCTFLDNCKYVMLSLSYF